MTYFVDYLPVTSDNTLSLFTDGKDYAAELYSALASASKFVFLTGLHFMGEFELVRSKSTKAGVTKIATVLAEVAERDVDVYLLVNQFWKDEHELFDKKRNFVRQQISVKGELWGYLPETWKLFYALSGYKNVHCRTEIHPNTYLLGTHHQKTVVIDDKIAFLGGVDLTFLDGDRWDTGEHLRTFRHDDRTQKFWHDVHMKVEGPAVQFVRDNFVQRWTKGNLHTLRLDDNKKIQADHEAAADRPALPALKKTKGYTYPDGTETGDTPLVQIVRSMPETLTWHLDKPKYNKQKSSSSSRSALKKIVGWERSCKDAYLLGIRAASKYIYLENQWVADEDIWSELAAAATRNKDNEDFRILIMIPYEPLFAAGLGSNQELWIGSEMEDVIDASRDEGTFGVYSIYKWEYAAGDGQLVDSNQIYVHSKILVVDDVWALVGSANAGGISLEGLRPRGGQTRPDSELSAIVLDPTFVTDLRVSLWEEHLGRTVDRAYKSRDADQFRRIAGKDNKRVRFFPGYEMSKRGAPTWFPVIPRPDKYPAKVFEKASVIVPSFADALRWNLPPTLVPATFTARVLPSPPRGYRLWYRWKVELFYDVDSGDRIDGTTIDLKLRGLRYDKDDVYEYCDQEVVYIGAETAKRINSEITTDLTYGRILCRVQIVPLDEGPDPSNGDFESFVLEYGVAFIEEAMAKNNLDPGLLPPEP